MITNEESKIKELAPDGYFIESITDILPSEENVGSIIKLIQFKKHQQKDFCWYVGSYKEHIDSIGMSGWNMHNMILGDDYEYPFEIKIGLFKFICDDLGLKYYDEIFNIDLENGMNDKLEKLLPKQFIDSLI